MMGIAAGIRFEALKGMAAEWPTVLGRVRALEEALGLPEPPCEHRYVREAPRGIVAGMSIPEFHIFESLRELNSEFPWVKARIAAITKAASPRKR